jgi:hypothetical protein
MLALLAYDTYVEKLFDTLPVYQLRCRKPASNIE